MGRLALSSSNWFLILLALAVAIGLTIVYRLRRGVEEDDGSTTEADLLKDLEQAYYEGDMEEDEFRRVTQALRARKSSEPDSPKPTEPIIALPEPPAVEAKPEEHP